MSINDGGGADPRAFARNVLAYQSKREISAAPAIFGQNNRLLADFSLSSPMVRNWFRQSSAGERVVASPDTIPSQLLSAEQKKPKAVTGPTAKAVELPTPVAPTRAKPLAPLTPLIAPIPEKAQAPAKTEQQVPPQAEQPERELHDRKRTKTPCEVVQRPSNPAQGDPAPLDPVKDRDPELYGEIKGKVNDPRYIGQSGDITLATHDKKGRVNGCQFIENQPYWLAADATKSLIEANKDLEPKNKKIEVDHLNGAGRTFSQEESIAFRNSGVHAKPGKSRHGFGHAIDLELRPEGQQQASDDKDIRKALHDHGFHQGDSHGPIKNDLHHWSYGGPVKVEDSRHHSGKHEKGSGSDHHRHRKQQHHHTSRHHRGRHHERHH